MSAFDGPNNKATWDVVMDWLREPDYADFVDAKWLMDWANRRPLAEYTIVHEQAFRYRDQNWPQPRATAITSGTRVTMPDTQ